MLSFVTKGGIHQINVPGKICLHPNTELFINSQLDSKGFLLSKILVLLKWLCWLQYNNAGCGCSFALSFDSKQSSHCPAVVRIRSILVDNGFILWNYNWLWCSKFEKYECLTLQSLVIDSYTNINWFSEDDRGIYIQSVLH